MDINEAINNLSNSEIIKLIGLLVTILLAIFGLIGRAIFIKWKYNLDRKIKVLEVQNSQNELLLNTFSSTSNVSQSKRIESIEKFWTNIMELKKCIPSAGQLAYLILTPDELNKFFEMDLDLKELLIKQVGSRETESHFLKLCENCEKLRPFLGERLWLNFQIFQGFIGRSRYVFEQSVKNKKIIF